MKATSLLRDRRHDTGVSNTELFFDLVYVLAVTELSQFLRDQHSWAGILQAAVLLGMTWNAWVYTNWIDPDHRPTRMMLLIVMAASLVFSVGITRAVDDRGLWIGCGYAFMQIGRSAYAIWAMRGDRLQRNYLRILAWCVWLVDHSQSQADSPTGPHGGHCSPPPSASTCSAASSSSGRPCSGARRPRTGPSTAVTSPSGARHSC